MIPVPIVCYVTARKSLGSRSLQNVILEAAEAEIDLVQIREKDLGGGELLGVVQKAVGASQGKPAQVMVNDRLDIAIAAEAAGVHLGRQSVPAEQARRVSPRGFQIGVSCHSVAEVLEAEKAGADYVLLGPIFETPSKLVYGSPLGLDVLRSAAMQSQIPILALGGMTAGRVRQCREAGAVGIAGVRIFQEAPSIAQRVQEIRKAWGEQ